MIKQNLSSLDLSDPDFLDDYLSFAVWQPAYMAHWLYGQAKSARTAKTCFGLQMYLNMEIAFEALAKWYFALRDWTPKSEPLLWMFKKTEMKEGEKAVDYATPVALKQLQDSPEEQILCLLKQPSETELRDRGWSKKELDERSAVVGDLLRTLRAGLQNRAAGGGDLRRAYNNLKHGLLVLQQLPGLSRKQSAFLVAKVTRGQRNRSVVVPLEFCCDADQLRPLRDNAIATCKLIAVLLALIPWYYYTALSWGEYEAQPDTVVGAVKAVWKKIDELGSQS